MIPISPARTWFGPAALCPSVLLPGMAGRPATANMSAHYACITISTLQHGDSEAGGRTIAGHNKFAFSRNNSSKSDSYMSTVKL